MRVQVDRKRLLRQIKTAATIARTGDVRPILRNILIVAGDTDLSLTATDMSAGLRLNIEIGDDLTIETKGEMLVPAQSLQRVVDALTADVITVSSVGRSKCVIEAGESKFSLLTEDPRDFPKIHRFSETTPWIEVPSVDFVGLLKRIVFCAHNERSHFNMHGLLLKVKDERLTVVATNGQRLGVGSATIGVIKNSKDDGPFNEEQVVPADNGDILTRIVGTAEDEVIELQWLAKSFRARGRYGEVSLAALQGGFVPYELGIPNNKKTLSIGRSDLLALLRQISAIKPAGDPFMLVSLNDNKMTLGADVRDIGSSKLNHDVEWPHGPIDVYLNPAFLIESIKAMDTKTVTLEFGGQMDQPLLREDSVGSLQSVCIYSVVREP